MARMPQSTAKTKKDIRQPKISARNPPNTGATNLIFSLNQVPQAGHHDGPRTSKIQAVFLVVVSRES